MSQPFPISFLEPAGEPAMLSPASVSWQVFKNPVALFIGGITATVLELAEARIRAGVWDNTEFRSKPLPRLKRTGLAAMVTVYGAESVARRLIHGVNQRHASIRGTTTDGTAYRASEPELMRWGHTTASYGFLSAYRRFVREVTLAARDSFYAEALASAATYGAPGCPRNEAECEALFAQMQPLLEPSPVIEEFLKIMIETPALPGLMRPFQKSFVKAAIALLPNHLQQQLALEHWGKLQWWEAPLIRVFASLGERIVSKRTPAVQACLRLGLPANTLYGRSRGPLDICADTVAHGQ